MGRCYFPRVETFDLHTETMVLAGNFHLLGQGIQDRLVSAPVAELELIGLAAQGEPQNLVSQANAEDRDIAVDQLPDRFSHVRHTLRVTWAIGKEHSLKVRVDDG